MFEVTLLPILAASLVSVVLGFVWYHPRVFGGAWMRLVNVTPEMAERGKRRMATSVAVAFLASTVVAYVMNYFGIAWGVYDLLGAVELGFWCWAGFTAPTMLGAVLWEQRPIRYYLVVAGYWLIAFVAMAVVLVSF